MWIRSLDNPIFDHKFGDVGGVQWCLPAWGAWSIVREEVLRAHWEVIRCVLSCTFMRIFALPRPEFGLSWGLLAFRALSFGCCCGACMSGAALAPFLRELM